MAGEIDTVGLAFTSVGDEVMLNGHAIRVNRATPRMVSVYDAMKGVGLTSENAYKAWENMKLADSEVLNFFQYLNSACDACARPVTRAMRHLQVVRRTEMFLFPGRGQRKTPVANIENIVLIVSKLPGAVAQQFAQSAARTLTRLLGGDVTLGEEAAANAARQQAMSRDDPTNAARLFGEFVEMDAAKKRKLQEVAIWRETRQEQKDSDRVLADFMRGAGFDSTKNFRIVHNHHNQSVLGFSCSTTAFKKTKGIPHRHSMADYMRTVHLSARGLMANLAAHRAAAIGPSTDTEFLGVVHKTAKTMAAFLKAEGIHDIPIESVYKRLKTPEEKALLIRAKRSKAAPRAHTRMTRTTSSRRRPPS